MSKIIIATLIAFFITCQVQGLTLGQTQAQASQDKPKPLPDTTRIVPSSTPILPATSMAGLRECN